MMQTPWGAFTRGRWIVREQCIQLSVSWAAARFNWRSSSPLRDWPSEEARSTLMLLSLWRVLRRAVFIDRVMEYNPNRFSEGQMKQMWSGPLVLNVKMGSLLKSGLFRVGMINVWCIHKSMTLHISVHIQRSSEVGMWKVFSTYQSLSLLYLTWF